MDDVGTKKVQFIGNSSVKLLLSPKYIVVIRFAT